MRVLLNKIFSGKLGVGKLVISGISFLLGLTLTLISIQAYLKIQAFLNPKENFSDYIILNKEVGLGNTLFGTKATFSPEDIEELKKQEFAEDVGVFQSNHFQARASLEGDLGFTTDLFFEAVPARFIDNRPFNFRWNEQSDFLPLIVSQDFLNLYNFGFALGRGTPQLSKSTIGFVPLKVEISGQGGKKIFDARVVGFTERIPSVLVPLEFQDWANKNIGKVSSPEISRVILKTRGGNTGKMEQYFANHELSVGQDKLKASRIGSIVNSIMTVIFVFGIAFMAFSLIIVSMNFSLMIAEAKNEIQLLFQLGYTTQHIFRHLIFYLSFFLLTVVVSGIALFFLTNALFASFLKKYLIQANTGVEAEVFLSALLFSAIAFLILLASIHSVLRKYQ